MASQLSQSIAHDLFMNAGVNRKVKRLVLESEGDKHPGAGWGEKALADRVDLSLMEVRAVLSQTADRRYPETHGHCWCRKDLTDDKEPHGEFCRRARALMEKLKC
jgi:hypothetical protein